MEIDCRVSLDEISFTYGGWFGPQENREYRSRPCRPQGTVNITQLEYVTLPGAIWLSATDDDKYYGTWEDYLPIAQDRIRKFVKERMEKHSFISLLTTALSGAQKLCQELDVEVTSPRAGAYIKWKSGELSGTLDIKAASKTARTIRMTITPTVRLEPREMFTWIENGKVVSRQEDTSTNVYTDIPCPSYKHSDMSVENTEIVFDYTTPISNTLYTIFR